MKKLLSADLARLWRSLVAPFATALLLVGIGIGIFKRKNIR